MEPNGSEPTPFRRQAIYSTTSEWQLIPESKVKSFPDYIPQQIRTDYEEAYLIKDLSPKASATLSRRCLQGMIRDFWGISKRTLNDEIDALEEKIDSSTLQAIHALREIGNIGAHMKKEKGTEEILDVARGEAEALIGLIEILFKEWYIAKHEREEQLEKLVAMADGKKLGKKE